MIEWLIIALIPVELAVGLTIAGLMLNTVWFPIQKAFPEKRVLEPSFQKYYQSLSFGWVNAGFCYHITLDDEHLHIVPVRLLRWLGQQQASIPWEDIELSKKQPMSKRFARVNIAKSEVVAPAWCFEMLKVRNE